MVVYNGVMKEKMQCWIKNQVTHGVTEKAYKLEMTEDSKTRIGYVKEMLEDRTDLSFMVYFNHICLADPLFAGYVAALIDPKSTRKLIAPISYSHTEVKAKNIGTLAMKWVADASGVETHRVIQSYQIDTDEKKGLYTKAKAMEVNKPFFGRLREIAKTGTTIGCMICPEGHRSDTGALEKGEEGVVLIDKIIQPVVNIPLGISFENGFSRNGLNFGKNLVLNIGKIETAERKDKRITFESLMTDLAEALPMEMRGVWKKETI